MINVLFLILNDIIKNLCTYYSNFNPLYSIFFSFEGTCSNMFHAPTFFLMHPPFSALFSIYFFIVNYSNTICFVSVTSSTIQFMLSLSSFFKNFIISFLNPLSIYIESDRLSSPGGWNAILVPRCI